MRNFLSHLLLGGCQLGAMLCLPWPVTGQSAELPPAAPADLGGMLRWLPAEVRRTVEPIVKQPTLSVRSERETFPCTPDLYRWLLDHPDRVALAWKRLEIPCLTIERLSPTQFRWHDDAGTAISWRMVFENGYGRIWVASGRVKQGMLPSVPVSAVAVLRHRVDPSIDSQPMIHQQLDLYLQTDSRAAALATRLLGATAPRLARRGANQLLYFFSGVGRYLDAHPDETMALLAPLTAVPFLGH